MGVPLSILSMAFNRNSWSSNWIIWGTWWIIPLSKRVISLVISGSTLLIPVITGDITHLLSGMIHQVSPLRPLGPWAPNCPTGEPPWILAIWSLRTCREDCLDEVHRLFSIPGTTVAGW